LKLKINMALRRATALFSALILLCGLVLAQEGELRIRVEVVAGSAPVPNATVVVNDQRLITDAGGVAIVPGAPGEVRIHVTKDGFFPADTTLTADVAREWVVRIELQEQKTVEEEIRVYATRTDARVQDSPLHVEVLPREEIEEKMLMTPGDIVMMLNEMGGMRVQTTSPALGAASVRVQGMLGRYTSFLSDGLPLFGQQGAGLGLLQIPPMDLGQVEVIKGNASALYGSSAMAGVVNLISRRPEPKPVHELLVNRTTRGATDVSMFLASQLTPHWGASLLAGGDAQETKDVDGDGWADLAAYQRGVIRPRIFLDDGNGRTALLTGGVTYEDRSGGTMDGAVLPATAQPFREALATHRYDAGGNLQWIIGGRYVVAARFAASEQIHRHRFGEILEHDRHELVFGEASIRGTAGRNTWVAGMAAQRDAYRSLEAPRFGYTWSVPGVFVQDDFTLAPWLSLSGSGRVDFHNRYGTFFSPRVSALIRQSGWTSRISLGQGFFAPSPLTEDTEAAGLSRLVIPAPLVAERGRTASIDLTRGIGPLTVTATVFASNIDHPVYVDRASAYRLVNLPAPTRNRGAELLATWRKAPFALTGSYSYVHSSEADPSLGRTEAALTPRHSLGLVGMWEKEDFARFGIECYFTGSQRLENNPYRDVSGSYFLIGAMGEKKVAEHVRLFVNLENLLNVKQSHWDPLLLPSRSPDGRWTVDAWAPLDGRVLNGGVRFFF
jgi:iron complex outermembrane receptor protein